ncbi:MAG: ribokinase [Prochlorothrix sp.]
MGIYVLGSLNLDLVVQAPHLPRSGETLTGSNFQMLPGGKGANQAVAAARLGGKVEMVGRVGADAFGQQLRDNLDRAGVGTKGVLTDAQASTGLALITVAIEAAGANQIVLVPGANAQVGEPELHSLEQQLAEQPGPHWLLLQLEVPIDRVRQAAQLAKAHGATVILDPAPAPPAGQAALRDLYPWVDILTPNWGEAEMLLGQSIPDATTALAAAHALQHQTQVATVILTLGDRGLVAVQQATPTPQQWVYPALDVVAQDTTAAGDAFNGGLAVALSEGQPWAVALDWARAAGALATTQVGAQGALPDRAALQHLLQRDLG